MRVAVVGGGITGLTIGDALTRRGHEVVILEKGRLGGLAQGFPYRWNRSELLGKFYHHIFPSDRSIIDLIHRHGLGDDIVWSRGRIGVVARGRPWPFNSALDLLRFAPLGSLWRRLHMGWTLRYLLRNEERSTLDQIRCRDYFERRGNLAGYRALWEPLLKRTFADRFDDMPASFLWGCLRSRPAVSQAHPEGLGYLRGGLQRLFLRMAEGIVQAGGQIRSGTRVCEVRPGAKPVVACADGASTFDRVVWAASPERLLRVIRHPPAELVSQVRALETLSVTQLILIMRRRQTEYYLLSNMDPLISFATLVEHTNLVPPENYLGDHLLYVANYHRRGDPQFAGRTSEALLDFHMPSLSRIIHGFRPSDIRRVYSIRAASALPLYDLEFARRQPPWQGMAANVDLCGLLQLPPGRRSMSRCVDNALGYVEQCFGDAHAAAHAEPEAA
jgi:protoporphyrinogen oxidase